MTISIRNQRLSTTLMLLAATSIAIPALWLASGATPVQSAETSKVSGHCVKSLSKPNTQAACYDTFTATIGAATGGQITDAPADVRAAMKDQRFPENLRPTGEKKNEAFQPRGAVRVISILFSNADYQGATLTYTTESDCIGPLSVIDFEDSYVGDEWNDEAESIKTFANCFARLWEHRDSWGRHEGLRGRPGWLRHSSRRGEFDSVVQTLDPQ